MSISFITAKTFPQKLSVTTESINEIVNAPVEALDKSPILRDNQDILDIVMDYEPATLSIDISRSISNIEDIFRTAVKEDAGLAEQVKQLSSRIGTVRPATKEEDAEQAPTKTLQELAREELERASRENKAKH